MPTVRPLLPLLWCLASVPAVEGQWQPNGPEPALEADGALVYTKGFVGRLDAPRGSQTVMADAVRFHHVDQLLYATGSVVYRRPGIRIAADRLGLDGKLRRGEAWNVAARVEHEGRTLELTADHLELDQEVITLRDVDITPGHGGVVSFWAPIVRLYLRTPPEGAAGIEERVGGIELVSPTGRVIGLPVLWLPWLYRDFTRDYPWTVIRGGHTRRLGTYGRFWIGSHLPTFFDLHTTLEARVDRHSRAGNAGGANLRWQHGLLGRGRVDTYLMPEERIRDQQREELERRRARAYDLDHRTDLGAGALAVRTLAIPDPDDGLGDPTGARFLSDFLPDSLELRPLPRRSAAAAYTIGPVTFTGDTVRRHTRGIDRTDRIFGLAADVTPMNLAGPLHAGGDAWLEVLHRDATDSQAKRITGRGFLSAGHWFPGAIGLDATGGIKGIAYRDGLRAGVEEADAERRAGYGDAGVSWRIVGRFGAITHALQPRIGVEGVGRGVGDPLPAYGFQDPRDVFEEDRQYGTTGLRTSVVADRTLFHAEAKARWALRDIERFYVDENGQRAFGPSRLVDVVGTADGSPLPGLTLTTTFTYDARPRSWTTADATLLYQVTPWLMLHHETTLRTQAAGSLRTWEHRPAASLLSGRYRLLNGATFRPSDRSALDGWRTELVRRMVEGDVFMAYEHIRDEEGNLHDQRYSIGFTLGGAEDPEARAQNRWRWSPR